MRGVRKYQPKCIDCGETNPKLFYAHPTSRTGCQSRCKACDNKNRVNRQPPGAVRKLQAAVVDLAALLPHDRWKLLRQGTREAICAAENKSPAKGDQ